jgi:hypothetical protein
MEHSGTKEKRSSNMKRASLTLLSVFVIASCVSVAACDCAGNAIIQGPDQGLPQIGAAEDWGDIPVYPGAREAYKIQGNETYDGGIWTTLHGIYETAAGVSAVAAFYQDKMPANGWAQNSWNEMTFGAIGDFTKNDGKATAVIGLTNTDNTKTVFTIDKKYLR